MTDAINSINVNSALFNAYSALAQPQGLLTQQNQLLDGLYGVNYTSNLPTAAQQSGDSMGSFLLSSSTFLASAQLGLFDTGSSTSFANLLLGQYDSAQSAAALLSGGSASQNIFDQLSQISAGQSGSTSTGYMDV